jgi:NAD(P)-dependent dehydrogenase (short-subunit alcohol dehydrogenase family)
MINCDQGVIDIDKRLNGRRAPITGGGSGIGRASAIRLAREGACVVVADIQFSTAQAVVAEVTASGGVAHPIALDVGDDEAVRAAADEAARELGGLDTVVACAGIAHPASTHEMPIDAWDTMIRINLTGVFSTIRHSVPHLIDAGGGAIVTIGSVASLVAAGQASAYDASKGGVLQLTRAVAVEYAEHGIRANCVCPGLIRTGLAANSRQVAERFDEPGTMRPAAERIDVPIKGYADPEAVAAAAAYLVSDDASFVTGIAMPVDGGYTAV